MRRAAGDHRCVYLSTALCFKALTKSAHHYIYEGMQTNQLFLYVPGLAIVASGFTGSFVS